ncbi:MAG TPA: hypothetical protein VKS21_02515 [Spirochaetota bacterium]|nr:hypothetical protein [Spirochaetota bacterium]
MDVYLSDFPAGENYSVKDKFDFAQSNEIFGINLPLEQIKKLSFDAGSEHVRELVSSYKDINLFSLSVDYDFIRKNVEHSAEIYSDLALLKEIGIDNLILTITQLTGSESVTEDEYIELLRSFKKIVVLADKFHKNLIIKFTANHLIDTIPEAVRFMNDLLTDRIKYMLDSYSIFKECKIEPELVYKTLEKKTACVYCPFNFKGYYDNMFSADYDFSALRDFLSGQGFKGPVFIGADNDPEPEKLLADFNKFRKPFYVPVAQRPRKKRKRVRRSTHRNEEENFIPF